MKKLICSNCEQDYRETGTTYQRSDGSGRLDYLCAKKKGGCGCKVKPIDVEFSDVSCVSDSVNVKGDDWVDFTKGLSGLDKAYSEQETVVDALNAYHENESRVLVIPDLHAPFMHVKAIDFLKETYDKYECNKVVCLGDEIDYHRSSFHSPDPDAMGATEELKRSAEQLSALADVFPVMSVCLGNHSNIPKRQAYAAGLSSSLIKSNKDVLLELGANVEGWTFADYFIIDGIKYTHGTGRQAKARMMQDGISIVQGHFHSKTYIEYLANDYQLNFAMQLGALIDDEAYAFAYGKHYAKSHKNCGVVVNGVPTIEYMDLG